MCGSKHKMSDRKKLQLLCEAYNISSDVVSLIYYYSVELSVIEFSPEMTRKIIQILALSENITITFEPSRIYIDARERDSKFCVALPAKLFREYILIAADAPGSIHFLHEYQKKIFKNLLDFPFFSRLERTRITFEDNNTLIFNFYCENNRKYSFEFSFSACSVHTLTMLEFDKCTISIPIDILIPQGKQFLQIDESSYKYLRRDYGWYDIQAAHEMEDEHSENYSVEVDSLSISFFARSAKLDYIYNNHCYSDKLTSLQMMKIINLAKLAHTPIIQFNHHVSKVGHGIIIVKEFILSNVEIQLELKTFNM
jgi:uncharacterized LabA/DUF88 family protein